MKTVMGRPEEPLNSRDLALCQRVFDTVRTELGAPKDSEEAQRIAAIAIALYRQGVQDEDRLRQMVEAAQSLALRQLISGEARAPRPTGRAPVTLSFRTGT